ncbi:MAG: response regulator [Chitinophagaceae bacterium]
MQTSIKKILIIDDDDRNIFALKAVLTAKGFTCITAAGGLQALGILLQEPDVNVALVDMMMPGMDGYEVIHEARKNVLLHHVKLIAVTAQAMIGDREKCLAAGADGYVSKPVDIDKLLLALNDTLKRRG